MFIQRSSIIMELVLLFLFLLPFDIHSLTCSDNQCRTGSCDDTGACICDLPDPSTILDGDRPFFGGKYCDEVQIMCDGTNSFWCEHGARCDEIVHGEKYTCICKPGYSGTHCEHIGAPCGQIFCFHEAECLVGAQGDVCQCPPDWRGGIDCSLPTVTDIQVNSTASTVPHVQNFVNNKRFVVFFTISGSLAALVGAVILAKKFSQKSETTDAKFQHLPQMQIHGILDDDEDDDSLIPDTVHNDHDHL